MVAEGKALAEQEKALKEARATLMPLR
ncbi:hypothetical protein PA598K_05282, partial [Paenibacillus sp. 598K]